MIEETGTSGCESTEQVSNSHGDLRWSKRRRVDSEDEENFRQLKYHSRSVNFKENVVLMALSDGASDHSSSFICSVNHDSRTDLKTECITETEILMSRGDSFRRETSTSSVVSLESREMELLSTSTLKKKKKKNEKTDEATSGRKPPPPVKIPAAELEEFFSEAEKYEQKRFSEKYNYDILKDVPMEGRYQWLRLKP